MRRKVTLPVALLLLLVFVIAGCGGGGSSSSSSTSEEANAPGSTESSKEGGGSEEEAPATGVKVSYLSPVAAQPGQQEIYKGIEQGSKELGWSSTVLDSALSSEKQVSNTETAINQGDKAIASWTLDPGAAAGAYEKAQKAGIPVVGLNSVGEGLTSTIWWEMNLCEPGGPQSVTAERIAEIKPHAKTIMIGLEVAESTKEYSECFAKEAKKAGLEVIDEVNNEADNAAGSQKVFEPLLTKYPEVEAVWDYNDESAMGASAALLAAGKTIATAEDPEGIVVTGQNADADAVEAVEEGRLSWTWNPNNIAAGLGAVKLMQEAIEGGKSQELIVESELLDSETLKEFVPPGEREYTTENLPLKK
jgi:ribose transport system substrate-binding protein